MENIEELINKYKPYELATHLMELDSQYTKELMSELLDVMVVTEEDIRQSTIDFEFNI